MTSSNEAHWYGESAARRDLMVLAAVILSSGVSCGCDLRRPVVDSVFDGTRAA
jgi:hypothetical protein